MRRVYPHALNVLSYNEGGNTDRPSDPGGRTGYGGVTQRTYDAYRTRLGLVHRDVWEITEAEARGIQLNYWHDVRGDFLPAGLDLFMFDWGYLYGPGRATEHLQSAVDTIVDGRFGELTREAVKNADTVETILKVSQLRYDTLMSKSHASDNPGWWPRCESVESLSYFLAVSQGSNSYKLPKMKVLKLNSTGAEVAFIQGVLGIKSDGFYGTLTEKAVLKLQVNMNIAVDGVVGSQTWAVICREF